MAQFGDNRVVRDTGALVPVIQAPMAWIARASLVAAVSAAGGLGVLETSSRDLNAVKREYDAIRARTDRPIGINLAIKFLRDDPGFEAAVLDWVLDGRVGFVTTSAGDPRRYAERIKSSGVKVYHAVPSLQGALKAEDAGVDGLIVEGGESGGIRGADVVHAFALLQAVRERVALPIVAAGGIADGRGMAAAFALGAEGVAMGTRFVASAESPVHLAYKNGIVDADPSGTLPVPVAGGVMSRVIRTPLAEAVARGDARADLGASLQHLYIEGRLDLALGTVGESAGLIHQVLPVDAIIAQTVNGFWSEIDRLSALRR